MGRCLAVGLHLTELRCRNEAGNALFCYQHKRWPLRLVILIIATILSGVFSIFPGVFSNFLWSTISPPSSTETSTLRLTKKTSGDVTAIRQKTSNVERLLEQEFRNQIALKDIQITFLQGQIERLQKVEEFSPRVHDLAKQIPSGSARYALALKAISEKRFDEAMKMLAESKEIKEVEMSRIYETMGQTEIFAGRYNNAINWYQKALSFRMDDVRLLHQAAVAFYYAGKYAEAEPLYQRSLKIWQQALGKEYPYVASSLNNLAVLYCAQGKYPEAEPLYQRSLKIREQALGKDHPDVANSLNNLAELYRAQGKYPEAEPLYRRSLDIWEKTLGGKDRPDVATGLNSLAELYRTQGKYPEAEPLYRRSLKIREQALGKDHPDVANSLNNLAELYRAQGKYAEAEPLYQRSLEIWEQALGKDHPFVATGLNNLAMLYCAQGKYIKEKIGDRLNTIYIC